MDILITTFLIIIGFALYYYFKIKLNCFVSLGIPYVPGWPILGNMGPVALRQKHITQVIQDIYNTHIDAKYVGAFDFTNPAIVLRDLELIKDVTIKNFDSFMDRRAILDNSVEPLLGNLFGMTGEQWKEARSLLSPAFTSSKMKEMHKLMVDCGKNFVQYLFERSEDENKMVDTKDLFTKYTNDVIATCAFGIGVNSLKNPENEFYIFGKKMVNPEGMVFKFLIAKTFPSIIKWFNIRMIDEKVVSFFKNNVRTTIEVRNEKDISRPDMLQLMIDARGKEHKHLKLDITEMTAQAFIFFFGGFESASSQMCFIAHELAINPDVQKKLQNEIDATIKKSNENPSYEIIKDMPYLDAVFNESLRMHTQASMLDRLCTKAFELPASLPGGKSFTVKPGMNIWIPASAIHRDPKYYDNPNKFDPDRYYNKKVTINDVYNLGFGIGPRSCIANRFAILETKILIFYILANFNLRPNTKTCNPLTYDKKKFNLTATDGFWLAMEPRQKN